MESLMTFAAFTAVLSLSLPAALGLVWLGLTATFRFLPGRRVQEPRRPWVRLRPAALLSAGRWTALAVATARKDCPELSKRG